MKLLLKKILMSRQQEMIKVYQYKGDVFIKVSGKEFVLNPSKQYVLDIRTGTDDKAGEIEVIEE